jgi:hypothetical protein
MPDFSPEVKMIQKKLIRREPKRELDIPRPVRLPKPALKSRGLLAKAFQLSQW